MKRFSRALLGAVAVFWVLAVCPANAQIATPGQGLFTRNCMTCHGARAAEMRAPDTATLMKFSPEAILASITTGIMREEAKDLTDDQKRDIAAFLGGRPPALGEIGGAKSMSNQCASNPPLPDPLSGPEWNGWGADRMNTRFQPAKAAGLSADQVPRLKLKWAFGFPTGVNASGQPAVASGRVFVGSDNSYVYSLNAKTGCVYWSFLAASSVRTAISIGPVNSHPSAKYAIYFGDYRANVYALDAGTGQLLWETKVDDHPLARITGPPILYQDRLYVPVASTEESASASSEYPCCTFRGSMVALDANTGRQIWKTYAIPETPKVTRKKPDGNPQFGPAGAGIWSAPTIDAKQGVIYAATGNSYSEPAAKTTDAILAFDMKSGKLLWSVQDLANDTWVAGCGPKNRSANCPEEVGPDFDFGASAILLRTLPNGQRVLIAAQKSGDVWAHDPDRKGAVLWRVKLARGPLTNIGLIVFGGTADERNSYFPLTTGGMAALKLANGEQSWFNPLDTGENAQPPRQGPRGSSSAASSIPGVVFSGDWGGILRALSAADGHQIWAFDMIREYQTINGVPAKGGSMGGPGPTVAGGMVFACSGYVGGGGRNGTPGNVLLAFGVD
jgi:polyvinyl alcohol dehydrogenase (cytochrome)